jgi:hypothetical protein
MYARNPGNEAEFWEHLYLIRDAKNGAQVSGYEYFPIPSSRDSVLASAPTQSAAPNAIDEITKSLQELQLNVLELQRRMIQLVDRCQLIPDLVNVRPTILVDMI